MNPVPMLLNALQRLPFSGQGLHVTPEREDRAYQPS